MKESRKIDDHMISKYDINKSRKKIYISISIYLLIKIISSNLLMIISGISNLTLYDSRMKEP